MAAVIAVGGHLVTDGHAPSWWVSADAEGNETCVSSIAGRG
ncbi:VOC family protein [Streptomyces albicerus]|nr:VOC family protein [Streptomyces albicerus]